LVGNNVEFVSKRLVYRPVMMEFDKYSYQFSFLDFVEIEDGILSFELNLVDFKDFDAL
jgi:hypothetical protein